VDGSTAIMMQSPASLGRHSAGVVGQISRQERRRGRVDSDPHRVGGAGSDLDRSGCSPVAFEREIVTEPTSGFLSSRWMRVRRRSSASRGTGESRLVIRDANDASVSAGSISLRRAELRSPPRDAPSARGSGLLRSQSGDREPDPYGRDEIGHGVLQGVRLGMDLVQPSPRRSTR